MVRVVVCNATEGELSFESIDAAHGSIQTMPKNIAPWSYGEFFAASNGLATGTSGTVRYKMDGDQSIVIQWDNPFIGRNSSAVTAPPNFKTSLFGNEGNRTVLGVIVRSVLEPGVDSCAPKWVANQLSVAPQSSLTALDESIAFLTTSLFKKHGISGWVTTSCEAIAKGNAVRPIAHSTDGFYTLDLALDWIKIGGYSFKPSRRYIRVEIEPGYRAHEMTDNIARFIKAGISVSVTGAVEIDSDGPFLEIHPQDPDGIVSL